MFHRILSLSENNACKITGADLGFCLKWRHSKTPKCFGHFLERKTLQRRKHDWSQDLPLCWKRNSTVCSLDWQESYGEDPFLSGQLARAFVKGLQGSDERYLQVNAGCKHFAAYAGPENTPPGRFKFDAQARNLRFCFHFDKIYDRHNMLLFPITSPPLLLWFLRFWKEICVWPSSHSSEIVRTQMLGVSCAATTGRSIRKLFMSSWNVCTMGVFVWCPVFQIQFSYWLRLSLHKKSTVSNQNEFWPTYIRFHSVNGIPACANKWLLNDILRKEWKFPGYVVSDEGAIEIIMTGHSYTSNRSETAAAAVNAGSSNKSQNRECHNIL